MEERMAEVIITITITITITIIRKTYQYYQLIISFAMMMYITT